MEPITDVIDFISSLLDSGKYKEALIVPNEQKYIDSFKDNCWDLISVIIGKVENDTIIIKPSLYGACEELLYIIIEKSTPEEALLEFIEQIEVAKNDAQFGLILGPLKQLLIKLSVKRGRSLEWCLNSISTYIENIPIPEHQLEGKERLLLDSDNNIRRIVKVYTMLPHFYGPFITELTVTGSSNDSNRKTKQIITAFLVSLLGKPLIYIDLDPDTNAQSEARQCCNAIMNDICKLEKNVFRILGLLEECHKEIIKKAKSYQNANNDEEVDPYHHREKINMTTLSGLAYVIFSGDFEFPDFTIPQVYSIEFIVYTLLLSVNYLLNFAQYGPLAKGITLCRAVLNRLSDNIPHTLLSSSVHFELLKGLSNVAIYSVYEPLRKSAVNLCGIHVNKFGYKGRCILIKYLIETTNHSGMIGYAITLFKNSIDQAFKDALLDDCFSGAQFESMIKKICYLPHGAESDLVELADQIISSLNFLRYLSIKDIDNRTGIRDCYPVIERDYLDNLRTGLNMSKAHYEVKLKDLEEGKQNSVKKVDVSLTVGGNVLDKIPIENKKEIINSALNVFHLIEGLVARLSECVNINKMKALSMDSIRNGHKYVLPLASVPVNKSQRVIRNYCQSKQDKEAKEIPTKLPVTNISTEHEEQQYEENVKNHILFKALEHVTKTGWSVESLSAGAEAAGYPGITHGLFPNGGGDLVHYFNVKCNEDLVTQMKSWPKEDLKANRVPSKFIENAILTRLLMIEPYKSTWPKAMAIQTLPNNVSNCLATLLSLVDDICYHSGDRSVDVVLNHLPLVQRHPMVVQGLCDAAVGDRVKCTPYIQ
ncbi:unnamed protein product [Chilo suppressalis]|uniref:Ubiquinone biosynthesis protein COQ9 HTH domain-containing protein n=1 Tax=Chilo suppressalis TaxID=168631 RepID=A0ABN8L5S4_CHISP|nr:unnamed protein product [Chilo suppressalis]